MYLTRKLLFFLALFIRKNVIDGLTMGAVK